MPKDLPLIESVERFEEYWVEWWRTIQPWWQDTESWPFAQEDGGDWGDLLNGGKDGLFLVVLSLGWWIDIQDPSEESKVDDAVEDVTWVIDNLVAFLWADAVNPDSSTSVELDSNNDTDSVPSSPATRPAMPQRKQLQKKQPQGKPVQRRQSQKKWPEPLKIGPPAKRAKHARS